MSTRLRDVLMERLDELRHEPTEKRIRATLGDETVIDSTRALLVWEPKRVVPTYAVPVEDVLGEIGEAPSTDGGAEPPTGIPAMGAPMLGDRAVYDPSVPFAVHTTRGRPVEVSARGSGRSAAAFVPEDAALTDFVVLDFDAFDAWYEEDERNYAHPRDPFHRIDIVRSSRHVRVELDGETLADSARARLLFEPPLPVRYYLPPDDVRTDRLRPSAKRTFCAYKGQASYWSAAGGDDIAWSYPQPLREAAEVADHYAFFNERVDVSVDGVLLERPVTPWSPR